MAVEVWIIVFEKPYSAIAVVGAIVVVAVKNFPIARPLSRTFPRVAVLGSLKFL